MVSLQTTKLDTDGSHTDHLRLFSVPYGIVLRHNSKHAVQSWTAQVIAGNGLIAYSNQNDEQVYTNSLDASALTSSESWV